MERNKIEYIKKIIEKNKIKLSKNEKKFFNILVENDLDKIFNMKTSEIEKQYGINKAIFTRFSQKLGFKGFNEFKFKIDDVFENNKDENIVFKSYLDVINDTELLSKDVIDIIKRFDSFDRIYVFGMGESSLISYELEYLLTKNGLKNIVSLSSHYQAILKFETINENYLFICISLSGENHMAVELSKRAKLKNAKLLAISNNDESLIKKISDAYIKVASPEKYYEVSKMLPLLLVSELIVYNYRVNKNKKIKLKMNGV